MELSVVARHSARSSRVAAAVVLAGVGVAALAGSSVAVVSGAQIVSATSVRDTADAKSATAACPPAQRVIGTGVDVESPGNRVLLEGVRPTATDVTSTAHLMSGSSQTWAVQAYGTCADRPAGLRIVSATSPTSPASPKSVTAVCPDGQIAIGTGAEISGGNGNVVLRQLIPDGPDVTATGDNIGSFDEPWSVRASAICADRLAGYGVVTAPGELGSRHTMGVQANCRSGQRLLGA